MAKKGPKMYQNRFRNFPRQRAKIDFRPGYFFAQVSSLLGWSDSRGFQWPKSYSKDYHPNTQNVKYF
jgi:hypothetical protein